MSRALRWVLGFVVVFWALPSVQAGATGGPAGAVLTLQVSPLQRAVVQGSRASVFVHSGAFASVTLTVAYADNLTSVFKGSTDTLGRYVFSWVVPSGTALTGVAGMRVAAARGSRSAQWQGTLTISAPRLPPLFVQAVHARFEAGTPVGLFVSTAPNAGFTYSVRTSAGSIVGTGSGTADSQGRSVIDMLDTVLPKTTIEATAAVTVTTVNGSRMRTARFDLTPRPPLVLFVSTTTRSVRAGDGIRVFVSTKPGAAIKLTMAVTSTVVLSGTGVADKYGRWVYSTPLLLVIKHQGVTKVTVQVASGLDERTARTTFVLRPGPLGLTAGGFDRLATPIDPPVDLSKYFSSVPDKVIVVSTEGQVLREFDHGVLVHENYVTTGRPELPTVHGVFHVYLKQTPFTFISPWPAGSPFYYPPSPVRYWMPFFQGYGLHDSPWRSVYGPGTNLPHYSTDPGEPVGSHGCVNIPLSDMVWLWNWAPVGTTVLVY